MISAPFTRQSAIMTKFFRALARWPACVAAGPFLFFSGQMGFRREALSPCESYDDVKGAGPGANGSYTWVNHMEAPVGAQAIAIYEGYRRMLAREGGDLDSFVRYHIYQRDKRFFSVFDRVRRHYEPAPPASTAVGMGAFDPGDQARLCIDAIAYRPPGSNASAGRTVLGGSVQHATAAHFSHVIGAGPYRFVAGQIPIDTSLAGAPLIRNYDDIPEEGRFLRVGRSHEDARNGPIAAQTWFTYDLIRKHLEAAGSSLGDVLNLIVYLQDMRDFPTFHRVHERFFASDPPSLTVVECREVGHKGTLIEIEPTAIAPQTGIRRRVVAASTASAQMSLMAEAGGLAFLSGIVPAGSNGIPIEARAQLSSRARRRAGNARSIVALQAAHVIDQLERRMSDTGHDLSRVVHLTLYVDDIAAANGALRILEQAFGTRRPALTVLQVPQPSPLIGARLQLTAIAWVGKDEPRRNRVER